jgi:hypothetical protein
MCGHGLTTLLSRYGKMKTGLRDPAYHPETDKSPPAGAVPTTAPVAGSAALAARANRRIIREAAVASAFRAALMNSNNPR